MKKIAEIKNVWLQLLSSANQLKINYNRIGV